MYMCGSKKHRKVLMKVPLPLFRIVTGGAAERGPGANLIYLKCNQCAR